LILALVRRLFVRGDTKYHPVILFFYDHVIAVLASFWGIVAENEIYVCPFQDRYGVAEVASLEPTGACRSPYLRTRVAYRRFGELVSIGASSVAFNSHTLFCSRHP